MTILEVLVVSGMCKSKNEARRLVEQGAITLKRGDTWMTVVSPKQLRMILDGVTASF